MFEGARPSQFAEKLSEEIGFEGARLQACH